MGISVVAKEEVGLGVKGFGGAGFLFCDGEAFDSELGEPQFRKALRPRNVASSAEWSSRRFEPLEAGCNSSLMSLSSSFWKFVSSSLAPFTAP